MNYNLNKSYLPEDTDLMESVTTAESGAIGKKTARFWRKNYVKNE